MPLYDAIYAGCISAEADVWLSDEELYVGHSTYALTPNRTLKSLYINPLLDILVKQNPITRFHPKLDTPPNGVFDTDPSQTLILLIDFKTDGDALVPYVQSQLEPLRRNGYLTHFNGTDVTQGPVTVVASGNAPFGLLTSNTTYRDVFFDAPLDRMADAAVTTSASAIVETGPDIKFDPDPELTEPTAFSHNKNRGQGHPSSVPLSHYSYSHENSYYASASFTSSIGHVWRSHFSPKQLAKIRAQISGAHERGLKVRYWDLPGWPRGLRNYIWHVLIREGVDVLNVDDLVGATRRDWRKGKGWWW